MSSLKLNSKLIPKQSIILWENVNPGSNFNAQTISLDLTNFIAVEISFDTAPNIKCSIGSVNNVILRIQDSNGNYTGSWFLDVRTVNVNTNNIVFSDNLGMDVNSTNSYGVRNNLNRPLKIYGISE